MERETAYRSRCYPNSTQRRDLARTFGAARFVYNWALSMRTDAFYERGERISYVRMSAALTALKQSEGYEWMNEISSVPMQQALRHLDTAYKNFFAGRAKYPTFHKKHGTQAAEYTTSAFRFRDGSLTLAKMDAPLKIRWSRPLPADVKVTTVTVSMDSAEWYGRNLVEIDRWYPSSKRCSDCGHVVASLPLDVRSWACPECGVVHDRDVNAAINLLAVGQTVSARGGGVRPKRHVAEAAPVESRILSL